MKHLRIYAVIALVFAALAVLVGGGSVGQVAAQGPGKVILSSEQAS